MAALQPSHIGDFGMDQQPAHLPDYIFRLLQTGRAHIAAPTAPLSLRIELAVVSFRVFSDLAAAGFGLFTGGLIFWKPRLYHHAMVMALACGKTLGETKNRAIKTARRKRERKNLITHGLSSKHFPNRVCLSHLHYFYTKPWLALPPSPPRNRQQPPVN